MQHKTHFILAFPLLSPAAHIQYYVLCSSYTDREEEKEEEGRGNILAGRKSNSYGIGLPVFLAPALMSSYPIALPLSS